VTRRVIGSVDAIMNLASESHVDRSIADPVAFTANNTALMMNLLEYARYVRPKLFLQMSTDEVYGPAPEGMEHAEWSAVRPSNPYSASKAAQEAFCFAYWRTYGVPVVITNAMNIFGETQDPEKFLPMVVRRMLRGEEITVHVGPDGKPGSRFYLHARNFADAWLWLARNHRPAMYGDGTDRPDRFNIAGEMEIHNDSLVTAVAAALCEKIPGFTNESRIKSVEFHASRPGHDLRYALDGSKIRAAGWKQPVTFGESLSRTVHWYADHREWL
jgi:dTDP-glucose 4,6-dehydratase